jgi:hypothetical protein
MTRLARVVAVGVPHHVTQRGNARQQYVSLPRSVLGPQMKKHTGIDIISRYLPRERQILLGTRFQIL